MKNDIKISPSILASDYANLQSELERISTSDLIHVDVMDGHFVPNISIGAPVVASIKKVCNVPFDVHLMISNPIDYVEDFANAGADIICFHTECDSDVEKTVDKIISLGKKPALAIKPATPIDDVVKYLDKLSMVLVMTVEPGFGGQSFMESTMPKIEAIRKINPDIDIEVDGGINPETIKIASRAGANVFVAGSAVFKSENPAQTIALLKKNAADAQ
ncbi:ribulose-phosphate 3-epimerase [uncultured Eubacterium sp.]|uniref:ribulose-phosphate 3-epimerase n=1 Tax=uncultured Eubacterium sp. TaxID=165185 RepID=UPI002805E86C|nr:ribulose-phosphate 3-epimerase [uncultured Eubacterium sp.]